MDERDTVIYFAYGSNMLESRIKGRAPSAVCLGVGMLRDMKVLMNKRGVDGSGKANLVESPGGVTYGVLYRIAAPQMPRLDAVEAGYDRRTVEICHEGKTVEAQVYISRELTDDPAAYDDYKDIVLRGAEEHGLPEEYIGYLRNLPSKPRTKRQ